MTDDNSLAVPEDDAPAQIDAADLMETPEGLVRVGDEFRDPEKWKACDRCGADNKLRATSCFNCGAEFDPETVEEQPFDHGDHPVIGECVECGREIHEGVTGHGCDDGFKRHPEGEGIDPVDDIEADGGRLVADGGNSKPDPAPRLRRILAPYADDLEAAAVAADDLELEDTATVLAAIARGEHPPEGALKRMADRLTEEN